jgi:transcriptional regulator with XRE-family HTH domain
MEKELLNKVRNELAHCYAHGFDFKDIAIMAGVSRAVISSIKTGRRHVANHTLLKVYEAIKSEDAGNRDEERQMLSERDARDSYRNSPAYRDARGMDESDEAMSDMTEARKNALKGIRGY